MPPAVNLCLTLNATLIHCYIVTFALFFIIFNALNASKDSIYLVYWALRG